MQKYVIVMFLEDVSDGLEFTMSHWPLHITFAGNFTISQSLQELMELIGNFAKLHSTFEAIAGDDDYFGSNSEVQVTKLLMNPQLKAFHDELITALASTGAVFDHPEYNNEGYIAHATVWHEKRLHKGEKVVFNKMSIVDMFLNNDIQQRKIVATFLLQ